MEFHFMHGMPIFFYKLVGKKGRILKVDDYTLHKVRFYYARLLITTSVLCEINEVESCWINGKKYVI